MDLVAKFSDSTRQRPQEKGRCRVGKETIKRKRIGCGDDDRSLSGAKLQPNRPGIDIRARYDYNGRKAQPVLNR